MYTFMTDDLVFLHISVDRTVAHIDFNFLNTLYLKQWLRLIETCSFNVVVCVVICVAWIIRPLVFMLRFSHTLQLQASWSSSLTNGRSVGRRVHRGVWIELMGILLIVISDEHLRVGESMLQLRMRRMHSLRTLRNIWCIASAWKANSSHVYLMMLMARLQIVLKPWFSAWYLMEAILAHDAMVDVIESWDTLLLIEFGVQRILTAVLVI